ncbi:hypothetical+protein [Methylocapsa aurea]|jgi:hypothetical protein
MNGRLPRGVLRIDPDDFLETSVGRVWTPERSRQAWNDAFDALRGALAVRSDREVLVVCGLQGAGKSTWVVENARSYAPCICFDAALPGARHRAPIIEICLEHRARARAIWIKTQLEVALKRNASRPLDQRVPEASIRSVSELFEPPSLSEGFFEVVVVENG